MGLKLFGRVFEGRRVLVTGHTGFKGSWLCLWLKALGADVTGIALDPDTQPSHWTLLGLDGVRDIRIDLADLPAITNAVKLCAPEIIFHLAAQPLVRASYRDPLGTFATNVTGLLNLLDAVRRTPGVRVLVNATTDKVYADHPREGGYREDDPLGGHDPYSSSKACAEIVTDCYRKSFLAESGIQVATARAGNVIGGGDWAQDRLVPDIVRAAVDGTPLRIRYPTAIRPWQHVLEPLSGYLALAQALFAGGPMEPSWNFGPLAESTVPVAKLVSWATQAWPELSVETDPGPHSHEAASLMLNARQAHDRLGWAPVWDIDTTFSRTIEWYRAFTTSGRVSSHDDLAAYVGQAREKGMPWAS